MGLSGTRFAQIVKAKISALLNRAENPNETLDYSYEKQLESLQNVKRGVADVVTAKKRLEIQTQQLEQNVVKLDTQARQALAAGREDLARQALERKSGDPAAAPGSRHAGDSSCRISRRSSSRARSSCPRRIEQFRSQKEVIKAQYSAAEAQVRIGEAATGIGREMDNTGLAIQRAKDKTEQMQARASAIDELVESGGLEELGSRQDPARPRARAARLDSRRSTASWSNEGRGRLGRREEGAWQPFLLGVEQKRSGTPGQTRTFELAT